MPHDAKGQIIQEGDEVVIRARVKRVDLGDQYCNVTLEALPMPPYEVPYSIVLNTRQVEKVEPTGTFPNWTPGLGEPKL